jgi:hypothetical protein
MKRLVAGVCVGFLGIAAGWGQQADGGTKCADLAKLALPHTAITRAEVTESGKLSLPDIDKDPVFGRLPAFCRVVAESHPSADSKIAIEAWLPLDGWSGRFQGVGNGGFAGSINYRDMANAVLRGDSTAGTDTGHTGSGIEAGWALGHPEKIADFGYRAVHEMTLSGEAIAAAFYGRAAGHRYFASCSDGGREALMEAQRFPDDYDGILAGAPAFNWTDLLADFLYTVQTLQRDPASYIPAAKLPAVQKAVLASCAKGSGAEFLDDPRQCQFDASILLCTGADTGECLTAPQVAALKALYAGPNLKGGKTASHGWMPGAETGQNGWAGWITGPAPGKSAISAFASGYLDDMVYNKADLDLQKLDLHEALKNAQSTTGGVLDAVNPDLSGFYGHGGKLILYHGWNDPAIPALDTVDYFNKVVAAAGKEKAAGFVRLFLVPGMQHCAGGPGATAFGQGGPLDDVAQNDPQHSIHRALEAWVEKGNAPERVTAAKIDMQGGKFTLSFTRPICPYPQAAAYSGSGDRNSAASYVCAVAK